MRWWARYIARMAWQLVKGLTVGPVRFCYWTWYYAGWKTGPRSIQRNGYLWGAGVAWLMWRAWYWSPFWWSYDLENRHHAT